MACVCTRWPQRSTAGLILFGITPSFILSSAHYDLQSIGVTLGVCSMAGIVSNPGCERLSGSIFQTPRNNP